MIMDYATAHANMAVAQRVQQFDLAHTRDGEPAVVYHETLLFADGARRDSNPLGPLEEPPEDSPRPTILYQKGPRYELLRRIAFYWELRLKRAVEEFDTAKEEAMRNEANGWTQQDATVAKLTNMAWRVRQLKEKTDEARAARDAADPAIIKRTEADVISEQITAGKRAAYAKAIKEIMV